MSDAGYKVVDSTLQAARDVFVMLASEVATNIAERLVNEEEVPDAMLRRYDTLAQQQRRCDAARVALREDLMPPEDS